MHYHSPPKRGHLVESRRIGKASEVSVLCCSSQVGSNAAVVRIAPARAGFDDVGPCPCLAFVHSRFQRIVIAGGCVPLCVWPGSDDGIIKCTLAEDHARREDPGGGARRRRQMRGRIPLRRQSCHSIECLFNSRVSDLVKGYAFSVHARSILKTFFPSNVTRGAELSPTHQRQDHRASRPSFACNRRQSRVRAQQYVM